MSAADQQGQVLGHLAAHDRLDADPLERVGERGDLGRPVQLAAVGQAPGPGEDRGDRVGRGRLALLVLAVVPGDGAVRGLGLDGLAVRGHQHAGHQAERAEALGDDVGLHVAVVVLAGPHDAAVALDDLGDHVVDQPVLVGDPGRLELGLELGLEDLGEDVLEAAVVGLQDRVLGGQVQRVLAVERVPHGGPGEVARSSRRSCTCPWRPRRRRTARPRGPAAGRRRRPG